MKHILSAFPAPYAIWRLFVFFLMLVVCPPTCVCQAQSLEEVLSKLDEAVARRKDTQKSAVTGLEVTRIKMKNDLGSLPFDVASTMTLEYDSRSIDSAIYYSKQMLAAAGNDPIKIQQSKIWLAREMTLRGEYTWAEIQLNSLGDNIFKENRHRYYQTWDLLCTWQNEHISPNNEILNSSLWSFADSVYTYEPSAAGKALFKATSLISTNPHVALDSLRRIRDKCHDSTGWMYLGKRLGLCYQKLGVRDSAEYYFALSALSDMEYGIVGHTSLNLLSLMLLEDGDIHRAYHYTRAVMEDALRYGSNLRLEQASHSIPAILDSYINELEMRQQRINRILVLLATLLLAVSGVLYYVYRINKRLTVSRQKERNFNESLKQKEKELNEALKKQTVLVDEVSKSSKMKEILVGQYMRQCVGNIQQLEHYRLSLLKVASNGNMDKLVTAIKKSEFIEKELESFYHNFDESFLCIFPNFVENVNALLREECRITVPDGKLLTVNLRIQALIRLGLTDTEEIANFLRYSPRSIYNYRSRMRNNAICSPEEFEERVKTL